MHFHEETWERKAFLLAEQGITLRCDGEREAALHVCEAAMVLAQKFIRKDDPLYHWVTGGYGESLVQCERYEEAIHAVLPSCEWERGNDVFCSRMTMALSLLALNRADDAAPYLVELYAKTGDELFSLFPEDCHALIRERIPAQGKHQ